MMLPYLKNEEVAEQVIEATVKLGSSAVNATIDALNAMDSKNEDIRVREGLIKILENSRIPGLLKAGGTQSAFKRKNPRCRGSGVVQDQRILKNSNDSETIEELNII